LILPQLSFDVVDVYIVYLNSLPLQLVHVSLTVFFDGQCKLVNQVYHIVLLFY